MRWLLPWLKDARVVVVGEIYMSSLVGCEDTVVVLEISTWRAQFEAVTQLEHNELMTGSLRSYGGCLVYAGGFVRV